MGQERDLEGEDWNIIWTTREGLELPLIGVVRAMTHSVRTIARERDENPSHDWTVVAENQAWS